MRQVDKLGSLLVSWGCDKWIHLVMSLVVALLLVVFLIFARVRGFPATLLATVVTLMLGIGKEIYDECTEGHFDVGDVCADCIGLIIFYLLRVI